jgi:hypothetical protein
MIHHARRLPGVTLALALLAAACSPGDSQPPAMNAGVGLPEGHPPIGGIGASGTALTGVVHETMDGGGYTFALLDIGDRDLWVAGPQTTLTVGEVVALPDTTNMGAFNAESLGRTFDVLYFTTAYSRSAAPAVDNLEFQGVIKETMNAAGYTYLQVEADGAAIWLAAPETDLMVGQVIAWSGGMIMRDFRSNTLNRSFETLYFVDGVSVVVHP